jgi:hypothetical protein
MKGHNMPFVEAEGLLLFLCEVVLDSFPELN